MKVIPLDILGLFNHVSANCFQLTDRIKTDDLVGDCSLFLLIM